MASLRKYKSIHKFCTQLEQAAQNTLKPYLSQPYYTPKNSKTYKDHTFNSILRKEPTIHKQHHQQICQSNFCKEMEKLLQNGLWIQTKYRNRNLRLENTNDESQEANAQIKKIKTPTFSSFQLIPQPRSDKQQFEKELERKINKKIPLVKNNSLIRTVFDDHQNITKEYEQRLRKTQQANTKMKQKLIQMENQNEILKKATSQRKKQVELKRKSRMREQKIKNLLKEIGVPLVQRPKYNFRDGYMSSKSKQVQVTNYQ